MIPDGNAIIRLNAPVFLFLEGARQVRTVQHFQGAGVLKDVALGGGGKNRRVRVVGDAIVGPAAGQGVLKISRVKVRCHDELANIVEAGGAPRMLLGAAQRRQQQRCKDGNNGDDDQ